MATRASRRRRLLFFFGTRPEAIKMAPVVERLSADRRFDAVVAVSAQHRGMLDQVLRLFGLRARADLDVMREGQSLFALTSRVLRRFEPVLDRWRPDLVFVHGDTTTTFCGTLASFYKGIPVAHVEAGLRTGDLSRPFPEEANRRLTDALARLYFAPTAGAARNLSAEGVPKDRLFVTGNTVIDALLETAAKPLRPRLPFLRSFLGAGRPFILMTAHRRENFGAPFRNVFAAVRRLAAARPETHWVYPVHPNPNVRGPARRLLSGRPNIHLIPPLDYSDLVLALKACRFVVTDSGGLQEEAPALGKPVLVLREVTERPEAVRAGTVRLVGTDGGRLERETAALLTDPRRYRRMAAAVNPYGDGRAADRIAAAVQWHFGFRRSPPPPFRFMS